MTRFRTLIVGLTLVTVVAAGCEWNFEVLDGNGGANGRTANDVGHSWSSAMNYNGRPHVFYYDYDSEDLRHAYYNGQFWAFEVLDGNGGTNGRTTRDVGYFSAAMLYNGRPHVFYYDYDSEDLRHAYYNGQFWAFEVLDGNGGTNGRTTRDVADYLSAVLYNGRPHVFYYDYDSEDLRHAYYNGQFWAFEVLDGNGGTNGRTTRDVGYFSAAMLYNGRPHVFYYDYDSEDLRHAYYNGQFWAFEVLDGNGGTNGRTTNDVGYYESRAMVYNGRPHVFYYDKDRRDLRHAYYNGQFWAFEVLDGAGGANGRTANDVGDYLSVVLYNGRPHVFYRDNDAGDLRHAYYNGQFWAFEVLDGTGGANGRTTNSVGKHSSTILYGGRPHVFYYDSTTEDLRRARYDGSAWRFEVLDGNGGPNGRTTRDVGEFNSVVLYNGRPHVFYYDYDSEDFRHGWFG